VRRRGHTVRHYCALWSLVPAAEPFETPSSHIVYVQSPDGPAVLKLFKPPREEARSSLALIHYGGEGAVRVIAHDEQAILTRRALPGGPLSALVRADRDDEATEVLCTVAAVLHARGAADGNWTTVEEWGAGFERHRRSKSADRLPSEVVDEAQRLFFDLCRSQSKLVLLHGDLHHDNILYDERLGLLSIDPKGVLGEREYEFGAALRNPAGLSEVYADPVVMRRRVWAMSARLDAEPARILRWCFAQAVLSAVWLIEDGFPDTDIAPALEVAKVSRALLYTQMRGDSRPRTRR
jgi:streptomycin 6-kinase